MLISFSPSSRLNIRKAAFSFIKPGVLVLLVCGLIISGWLSIFNLLPVIQEAYAAQATIDDTISTTVTYHLGGSPTTVFTSQSNGYAFYADSSFCAYSKTADGGETWSSAVDVYNSTTNCFQIAVWYDRWTPGDTTGNLIHIAVIDTSNDDIFYRNLNTLTDTLSSGPVNITSGLGYAGSLVAGTNHMAITKGTDGALYANVTDVTDNMMVRCTTTCTTAGNWAVSEPASWTTGNDFQILVPMLANRIMFLWWDISTTSNDVKYSVWNGSSWSTFSIITTALDNTTYDASWGAAVDRSTGDVYLAYANQAVTLGTDDDVMVKKYSYTGGSWSNLADVVTNSACAGGSTCGVTGVKIARDENTGNLYVLYTARSTAGTATTGNVYWKYSTNGGSTWSSEFGPVYSVNDDIYGARLSLTPAQMIFATWYAAAPDYLFGRPIAPKTFSQSAYRLFNNTDSTDVGSALALQDTAATLGLAGAEFRLRMLVHINIADLFTNEGAFKLQYAQQSGTCDTDFIGESYVDVTDSTVIAYNNNATPSDGDDLTYNANDPTHNGHTIANQDYEEANNFTNSVSAVNVGEDGKWDFSLIDNGAIASTAYCLRVVKTDGTLFNSDGGSYLVIPQITTAAASFSTAIEVRAQNYTTSVSTITFPSGESGSTVAQPYNDIDGSGSPQTFGGAGTAKPVVTLYNSGVSTLSIWYNITTFSNDIVSSEYYIVNTKGAGCTDASCITMGVVFDTDTSTGQTITAGAGNEKDFYLKIDLGSPAGKAGNSTLTILGEAL